MNRAIARVGRAALRRGAAGVALLALLGPAPSEAAGPWRARVVDGDTRAPVEGVVVLAVWRRQVTGHPPIPIGFGNTGYLTSDEVLTGPGGQFTLPARLLFNPSLALHVVGPELFLFYTADTGGTNPRVMLFAPEGRLLYQWDVASGSAPDLMWPNGLAVDARGQVYVADLKKDRLHVLSLPPERQP